MKHRGCTTTPACKEFVRPYLYHSPAIFYFHSKELLISILVKYETEITLMRSLSCLLFLGGVSAETHNGVSGETESAAHRRLNNFELAYYGSTDCTGDPSTASYGTGCEKKGDNDSEQWVEENGSAVKYKYTTAADCTGTSTKDMTVTCGGTCSAQQMTQVKSAKASCPSNKSGGSGSSGASTRIGSASVAAAGGVLAYLLL